MLWRDEILQEITTHITQLGLTSCPVCGSASSLGAYRRPVVLPIGGAPWPSPDREPVEGSNILFMVMVRCEVCGHSLLFDSEKFHDGNTPVLVAE